MDVLVGRGPRHQCSLMRQYGLLYGALLLGLTVFLLLGPGTSTASADTAGKDLFIYDVTSSDGLVKVTVQPSNSTALKLPVTAENIEASGLKFESKKDWERYTLDVTITQSSPGAKLTYNWADGTLPWPVKISDWLPGTENRWYTDNFYTKGPAEVRIIIPKGMDLLDVRDWGYQYRQETGEDGRVQVIFDVPEGREARWIGVSYNRPWANMYSVYGKEYMPLYYPTVLGKYPEYMDRIKKFYEASEEFYATYKNNIGHTPPAAALYAISWVQGYGGAFTTGLGCYYNYRGMAGFECPPVTDGGRLMGAYHEMSHLFQPAGLPEFIGGHVWSLYLTLNYDYIMFPTLEFAQYRKKERMSADAEIAKAYLVFLEMREKNIVPGAWYVWPEKLPEVEEFIASRGCDYSLGAYQEKVRAYIMLKMERDFGKDFWGRYANYYEKTGLHYPVPDPIVQQVVAAQLGFTLGRDITDYLEDITGCDLNVELAGNGTNLIANGSAESEGAWRLESWQPTAKLTYDKSVRFKGNASLRLDCSQANDAKIMQTVKVEPNTYYLLSAWVKTDDVLNSPSGACICVMPGDGSHNVKGTRDWRQIALLFYSDNRTEMDIALRLGWDDRPTTGTVWFDEVELVPLFTQNGWAKLKTLGEK
ncbi:MAG TPA: hypothetical protein PLU88_09470 [Armatimonadota bacterium]|nr:hypothetical protein [Armatimonadota bacterium]